MLSMDRVRLIPDDEYNLDGNSELGRLAKAETIESYQYHIGYVNGYNVLTDRILALLDMSEEEIKASLKEDKKIKIKNDLHIKDLMNSIISKSADSTTKDQHIQWCDARGTDTPWATDTLCNCPGAYVIRKRMSEGMSFEDAKQWVIDNEQF